MSAPLKADVTAADRLLKAAVRRAVEEYRRPRPDVAPTAKGYHDPHMQPAVARMLDAVGLGAALLLGEA